MAIVVTPSSAAPAASGQPAKYPTYYPEPLQSMASRFSIVKLARKRPLYYPLASRFCHHRSRMFQPLFESRRRAESVKDQFGKSNF